MNTALIFTFLGCVLEVSSKTFYFADLCEGPSLVQIDSPHFSLRRFATTRRFGSTLSVKSGENLIVVLGSNTKTIELQDHNSSNSTQTNITNQKENSTYDCSFGFKSTSNLTFAIHWHGFINNCKSYLQIFQEANKIMLSLHEKGNYVFNATRLIPINLRVSTCENDPEEALLLTSFLKTFTINRSRWFSSKRANKIQKVDKPPKYDDLFPKNVKVESPPSYEECAKPKN
uniref:Uncharacterized protein n=1 Tax=Strigamia maritima TaxID=126957 RepID=T1JLN4_STRMM